MSGQQHVTARVDPFAGLVHDIRRWAAEAGFDRIGVTDTDFTIGLIPTTLARTTLGRRKVGEQVNLEVDVLAKYTERLLAGADR